MRSRYEVWLNNIALSSLDPKILILDIRYATPPITNSGYTLAGRHGSYLYRRYAEKSSVNVQFAIRAYDTAERQAVCAEVAKWAKNGGLLQCSDRLGQRLRCICEAFPAINGVLSWTDTLQMTFTAFNLPFWEEELEKTLTLTGTSASGTLYVPGSVDGALIEASIKANAALSSVNLTANGKTLSLTGLSVASGQTINITYDNALIQSIKVGSTSLLNKRTGADDLVAKCGENNALSMSADASVNATFKVRGLWL